MKCSKCGHNYSKEQNFCQYCGERLLGNEVNNEDTTPKKWNKVVPVVCVLICISIVVSIISAMTGKTSTDFSSYTEKEMRRIKVGDVIKFGSYDLDGNESNGKEDIEWIVLDKDDDRILVLSKYIVDYRRFHGIFMVTWEGSEIRYWLHDEFAYEAFSEEEIERIVPVENYVPGIYIGWSYDVEPTNVGDYIFLLDEGEVEHYLGSQKKLSCTRYGNNDKKVSWWLRSPGINHYCAMEVWYNTEDGEWKISSSDVDYESGVRPAMWIKL